MKSTMKSRGWRTVLALIGGAGLLLAAGCLQERVVWSPDGQHAAVIGKDGLYLCDADGRLGALLPGTVTAVAWRSDSTGVVIVRKREVKDWSEAARLLGPERAGRVEAAADAVWARLQQGAAWSGLMQDPRIDKDLLQICVRDRQAANLRARLTPAEWEELAGKSSQASELVLARLDGGKLVPGTRLYDGIGGVNSVRVSPNDEAVAFTAEMQPDKDDLQLLVAPTDGATPPVVVARNVSAYPDYFGSGEPGEGDIRLGFLARRRVLEADGRIQVADKPDYLVGALFNNLARVRCLRDGRILFNAMEISLPIAAEDFDDRREQLFALDPARQPTLVRLIPRKREEELPAQLSFFEVSPDERQIVFGSTKGEVCLLTLATGAVERIQTELKDSPTVAPTWRKAGEFTYVKRTEPKAGAAAERKAEVVLRQGKNETVLSQSWPDDVLKGVVE
jgi:hypothetical protein